MNSQLENALKIVESSSNFKLLFCVYDKVANECNPPLLFPSVAVANRFFGDLCKRDPVISSHSADFDLYCIGLFNSHAGSVDAFDEKVFVSSATFFLDADSK